VHAPLIPNGPPSPAQLILRVEPIPGGYRVIDANGLALAYGYGEPPNAIAISDKRLSNNEAEKIARLIARLPELVELEKDRNKARSRRKPQPLRFKPVTTATSSGSASCWGCTAATAGRSGTSISIPR
jgi:hypothetical protein